MVTVDVGEGVHVGLTESVEEVEEVGVALGDTVALTVVAATPGGMDGGEEAVGVGASEALEVVVPPPAIGGGVGVGRGVGLLVIATDTVTVASTHSPPPSHPLTVTTKALVREVGKRYRERGAPALALALALANPPHPLAPIKIRVPLPPSTPHATKSLGRGGKGRV